MSRIAKWKFDKTKVKVVFRLQFHATHAPQNGWDKLFISFIPADSGKATAKTTKANVRNGTCKWADPIYETTRLLQDVKTKKYDEKIYKLVVAMGSSRSSLLGEVTINLADYADALKPCAVALPLHGCDSGTILHVTVQLLTSKTGFREFEQQRELQEKGLQTTNDQNSHNESSYGKVTSSEETANDQIYKVNARVKFKDKTKELPSLEEVGLNEEYADSAVGYDGSSNTSESLYAEKHDISSTHEVDSLKSTISGDLVGLTVSQSPHPEKVDPSDHRFLAQGNSDWVHSWGSDYSVDNDLAIAYEENNRLRGSLEAAESSILELKEELGLLRGQADELGVETQKCIEQLATEIASGEKVASEVSLLKLECSRLKDDLEQLNELKVCHPDINREAVKTDQDHLFQGIQLRWLNGLLAMEDKIRELQQKACFGYNERDVGFLNADLESLFGVLQNLKQVVGQEISGLNSVQSERADVKEIRRISLHKSEQYVQGVGFETDLYQPDVDMLRCLSIPDSVSSERDPVDATNAMKGKIFDLLRELDDSKAEQGNLVKKMGQMECYYEALVQELEETQRQMLGELQNLRHEHSSCLFTVSSMKTEMETVRLDLNEQILRLAEENCNLNSINEELERRAATAEAALRRARLNYSIAVDQLQKDLELLSFQVLSMYETNENLIRQALVDTSQPSFQSCPEAVQNHNLVREGVHAVKLLQCQNQNISLKKQQPCGDFFPADLKRSLHLQEELYHKVEEEIFELHLVNMYHDMFSKTLQETLLEASADIRLLKEKMDELTQRLELSTESKELMSQKLQVAMENVHTLNEYKATYAARCDDLALQNRTLEANLQKIACENHLLTEKITECESLIMECRSYESKYKACEVEKTELENLLKKEAIEKGKLRNVNSCLQEELKTMKVEFDVLASLKDNLQNNVDFMQNKLQNLLSYDDRSDELSLSDESAVLNLKSKDLSSVVAQLEEFHRNACEKIFQLMEEKRCLVDERDSALVSLSKTESDTVAMKQKCKHDIRDMVDKISRSNAMVQKLQLEVESIANRLKVSFEVEERYAKHREQLLSDVNIMEGELQEITSKNMDLAQEILALETVSKELGRNEVSIAELTEENQALQASLRHKSEENSKIMLELDSLKESLQSLQDQLLVERRWRDGLESTVADLTSQLNEGQCLLELLDQVKSELVHQKQLVLDLESENSRVCNQLLHCEERFHTVCEESSSIADMEMHLSEMHEFSIAADMRLIFTRTQCEAWVEELIQKLCASETHIAELHKRHLDVESVLNHSFATEAHHVEEKERLQITLDSLRSELEATTTENGLLLDRNKAVTAELEEYKNKAQDMELSHSEESNKRTLEVERVKHFLLRCEEDIDSLMVCKEELEIVVIVFGAKLNELCPYIILLEKYKDEVSMLQNECNDLSQRLNDQILKTEEFKNLSIHLKELKDKVDAEAIQTREKRESEGPPVAMQESLRIAFIKEQYETRLQELKQQFSISKKHSEEMLWKLQDAIDEIENRKKSEASHLKKNEELAQKLLELESELQSIVSEKRERMNAYDLMKAEMECSLISLECCKEEKQKLEAALQDLNKEKSEMAVELTLMKELLESSTSPVNVQKKSYDGSDKVDCVHNEQFVGNVQQENPTAVISSHKITVDSGSSNFPPGDVSSKHLDRGSSMNSEESNDTCSMPTDEASPSSALIHLQAQQALGASSGVNGDATHLVENQVKFLQANAKRRAIVPDHFGAQSLKSSMDQLNKELERMKHENSLSQYDHHADPKFPGLQGELMQLHKVNEELGSIFPLFNEYPGSGNALERVLALEIELAEALRTKKKSSMNFQSSFLKQHSDEEAVFQSFRDINELIKDMLDIKGRYEAVETELRDMHDRYSQLSLQFAEVEGERQKLMMTLKSVRASKKAPHLHRSSSASLGDHSS